MNAVDVLRLRDGNVKIVQIPKVLLAAMGSTRGGSLRPDPQSIPGAIIYSTVTDTQLPRNFHPASSAATTGGNTVCDAC